MKKSIVPFRVLPLVIAGSLVGAASVFAAPITHLWSAGSGGDWGSASNWSPNGVPGINGVTNLDAAAIHSNVHVTYAGDIYFTGSNADKRGTFNALSLSNGAQLSVTGNLQTLSASGSGGTTRNALIDTGSTLNVSGTLGVGISNNGAPTSTWTVRGTVNTDKLVLYRAANSTGGAVLNIDGGKLNVYDTFNWGNAGAANSVGVVSLANGGELSVGVMQSNWTINSAFHVNFIDGSGKLTFGGSHWDETSVQNLITQGHILFGGNVSQDFNVALDNGDWTVTVIPEPSSIALLSLVGVAFGWKVLQKTR